MLVAQKVPSSHQSSTPLFLHFSGENSLSDTVFPSLPKTVQGTLFALGQLPKTGRHNQSNANRALQLKQHPHGWV